MYLCIRLTCTGTLHSGECLWEQEREKILSGKENSLQLSGFHPLPPTTGNIKMKKMEIFIWEVFCFQHSKNMLENLAVMFPENRRRHLWAVHDAGQVQDRPGKFHLQFLN